MTYDVAIVGGGPAGSTCGSLLKKYNPDLNVLILEREKFPRDHIGESQLPAVARVLDEMGVWNKVERADFPIKIGGTFRWGTSKHPWDLVFASEKEIEHVSRPGSFEGIRTRTAFQVDRSIYDEILLDHAAELGCEVREETRVLSIQSTGDRIDSITLEGGEVIQARHYVDASGQSGLLRRQLNVDVQYPTKLRNIAIWDYYQNADWAVKIGVGGTRILVMSLGYGWLWFIPLGPTRTSIGLVMPAEYYKNSGKKPEELFKQALSEEPLISSLMAHAESENKLQTTNDWSYVADRLTGENWFLAGDSCGFADPILSAGLTLAQMGARQVAYAILEIERGELDPQWIKDCYDEHQKQRIGQHIKFADFWYSANGQFSELKEYTREIAAQAGLDLDADAAFRWLGTGGFAHEDAALPMIGAFALPAVKQITQIFSDTTANWQISNSNVFKMDLEGATREEIPILFEGRIYRKPCFRRGPKMLPRYGVFEIVINALEKDDLLPAILERLRMEFRKNPIHGDPEVGVHLALFALEAMITDGWVKGEHDPNFPLVPMTTPEESDGIFRNKDLSFADAAVGGASL